ncbi:hypothetical protein H2198_006364 [Neophaeococcomyces mojaviensis]|uniref:Uncharacterized protein n=1 Tax=Neophaeococcomyces mojaviensis TaxID=3383035 RepID=A0ACC3A320_9EURO|nr:hypothetical protein H2198_006364 [Knufia sp. JES_112]
MTKLGGLSAHAQVELDALAAELKKDQFDDDVLAPKLANLKSIARTPRDAPAVYCNAGINLLAEVAFGLGNDARRKSSLEAARTIANALLLEEKMRQVFAGLPYIDGLLDFYSRSDSDHEFVGARILFLLTYGSQIDFVSLIRSQGLVNRVGAHLKRHAASIDDGSSSKHAITQMALTETLKLLYNLAPKCSEELYVLSTTFDALVDILCRIDVPSRPLDPPIGQLLNVLAIIDWPDQPLSEHSIEDKKLLTAQLILILDQSSATLKPALLETMLVPLITVLRKVYEANISTINEELRNTLLPRNEERDKPLGKSETLAGRLLQLQTSAGLTILPEAISGLLFDLSDRNATQFVHNIGYGHAAGYLMTHQIPVPQDLITRTTSDATAGEGIQINPITGQRLDAEEPVNMPTMTEEEKEREAQKMFVLFERLKANGVMKVENPLRTAQQSGRFEELSDSEPD